MQQHTKSQAWELLPQLQGPLLPLLTVQDTPPGLNLGQLCCRVLLLRQMLRWSLKQQRQQQLLEVLLQHIRQQLSTQSCLQLQAAGVLLLLRAWQQRCSTRQLQQGGGLLGVCSVSLQQQQQMQECHR
jgi:hypothetical protein